MPDSHAHLSPSASSRWLRCPASVRLADEYYKTHEEESSSFAQEGTLAHALGEIKAKHAFGQLTDGEYLACIEDWNFEVEWWTRQKLDLNPEQMDKDTDRYVSTLKGFMGEHKLSQILVEQKVDTGVPECWGTGDAIIVSPDHVHIVDLKYGAGVKVCAENNPQLMLYGVGALETYGDLLGEPETVTMTIFQPRLGNVSSYTMAAKDLREWRDSILPIAEDALAGSDKFGPGVEVCRWCPVAGDCRARMENVAREDFSRQPDLLSMEELSGILERLPEIKAWCSAVEAAALEHAYTDGMEIPGWKVVESRGRRYVSDPAAAIQILIDQGYTAEQVSDLRVKTLGALEKLVGKSKLPSILGDLLVKQHGKPALVSESDRRPAITPDSAVAGDFQKEEE